ncbi:MAG TPA: hypothetical protein ENN79_09615 [Desulfobacteraceae bacterium]|nr:hypothetical protein [Desulfobacteraceae bacterium]
MGTSLLKSLQLEKLHGQEHTRPIEGCQFFNIIGCDEFVDAYGTRDVGWQESLNGVDYPFEMLPAWLEADKRNKGGCIEKRRPENELHH